MTSNSETIEDILRSIDDIEIKRLLINEGVNKGFLKGDQARNIDSYFETINSNGSNIRLSLDYLQLALQFDELSKKCVDGLRDSYDKIKETYAKMAIVESLKVNNINYALFIATQMDYKELGSKLMKISRFYGH